MGGGADAFNPEVTGLPFVPGQTYRVAALVSGPVIPPSGTHSADTRSATAVVGYNLFPSLRYPDQYRVGSWSEQDVFPPLDGIAPVDQGLSTSNLTAAPSGPIVYFTGS